MKTFRLFLVIIALAIIAGSGCIKNPFAPDLTDIYADADGVCRFTEDKTQTKFSYNWNSAELVITGTSTHAAQGRVVLWDKHWEERDGYRFYVWVDHCNRFVDRFTTGDSFELRIEIEKDDIDYLVYVELHR